MKYSSNIQEVVLDLKGKLTDAKQVSALQRTIGTYLLASNLRRIHNDGVAVDGSQIGHYDALTPLYVNPSRSTRKFPVKGKTGKTRFDNGNPHKTAYFDSYKKYRDEIDKETAVVNLQLSGKLKLSFVLEQQGADWLIGFKNDYGKKISERQEEKWGKQIWGVTTQDRSQINTIINDFIKKINA